MRPERHRHSGILYRTMGRESPPSDKKPLGLFSANFFNPSKNKSYKLFQIVLVEL